MTARRDLATEVFKAQRDIDKASRDMQQRIGPAVRQHSGPMTQEARMAIMREVNIALDRYYPKRRGAPSRLQAIIEGHARAAQLTVVERAVAEMRAKAPAEIVERMQADD